MPIIGPYIPGVDFKKASERYHGYRLSMIICNTCSAAYGIGDSMFPRKPNVKFSKKKAYSCPRCKSDDVGMEVELI